MGLVFIVGVVEICSLALGLVHNVVAVNDAIEVQGQKSQEVIRRLGSRTQAGDCFFEGDVLVVRDGGVLDEAVLRPCCQGIGAASVLAV